MFSDTTRPPAASTRARIAPAAFATSSAWISSHASMTSFSGSLGPADSITCAGGGPDGPDGAENSPPGTTTAMSCQLGSVIRR
jgi:hypothetical protein